MLTRLRSIFQTFPWHFGDADGFVTDTTQSRAMAHVECDGPVQQELDLLSSKAVMSDVELPGIYRKGLWMRLFNDHKRDRLFAAGKEK